MFSDADAVLLSLTAGVFLKVFFIIVYLIVCIAMFDKNK